MMNWLVELIQFIDKLTGIGENYSFLAAGTIIIFSAMVAIAGITKLLKCI